MVQKQRHAVGIFSRDGEANYKWLIDLLQTMFQNIVREVIPVYISNNVRSFVNGLSQSTFAIVYHTKKRGRLNIANVTDSLYDQELEDLSRELGKENVIVLVDDVEDSSYANRRRIFEEQHLDTYATELIVISEREKESSNLNGAHPRFSQSPISSQMQDDYDSISGKLQVLRRLIEKAPHNDAGLDDDDESSSVSSYGSTSKGGGRSEVNPSVSFKSYDDESVRSSHQSGSGLRTSLIPPSNPVGIDMTDNNEMGENNHLHKKKDKSPTGGLTDQRNRKKDKIVFGSIIGLIVLLIIILIIVLSVTL